MNNTPFRADMHMHSTCSDGSLSPKELLYHAKEKGLSALSITDHDTTEAYSEELFSESKKLGLFLCKGVEFSCRHKDTNVHILGYHFQTDLVGFCLEHQLRRKSRNLKILAKLRKNNISIEEGELYGEAATPEKVIGRPHIASLLIRKGIAKDFKEAFTKYLGDKACCYDPGNPFSVEATIETIHAANGKAFIAHPHLMKKNRVIKDLLKMPLDGIECYYSMIPRDQEEKWLQIAKKNNLLISGGSDFHGEIKPHVFMGSSWIDEETFRKIMDDSND
ncbi:MAG: PHP domain-containing protein, partial [Simkaniaceae bacterium]|nr:PHP domain-containing protein [Simkaniaceae bacterium]